MKKKQGDYSKNNKTKRLVLQEAKIDKPLARLIKKKGEESIQEN